jgi:putative ABC transport system substrate-binding protein
VWRNTVGSLVILALGIILWMPVTIHAQPPAKMPRIGYLTLRAGPTAEDEAFKQGLRDLGWIEGQNIAIEYRWAAGQVERLQALAAELVRLQVDCITATATPVVQSAKDATQSIPIVMTSATDPVRTGLVASLARPGGNITGMAGISTELAGKHVERLRDLLQTLARIAFLAYESDPAHKLFLQEAQGAAARLGIQVQPLVVSSIEEIEHAFVAMRNTRAEALMIQPLFVGTLGQGQRIADLAIHHRMPTVSAHPRFAEAGGLMSYGADLLASFRGSAVFVDKILKGAKPSDLPVQQPTTFKFSVNLKTAKVLGLTIPPPLLFQADEVIQ